LHRSMGWQLRAETELHPALSTTTTLRATLHALQPPGAMFALTAWPFDAVWRVVIPTVFRRSSQHTR
jgi:hypothetical protein